jgi:pyruvate kinase
VSVTLPKTKIVCITGPASDTPEVIREMITGGMRVARLNFSHGTHVDHEKKIHAIRKIAEELSKPVAILQDLGGPKIRVGVIPDPGIRLEPGRHAILSSAARQRASVKPPPGTIEQL